MQVISKKTPFLVPNIIATNLSRHKSINMMNVIFCLGFDLIAKLFSEGCLLIIFLLLWFILGIQPDGKCCKKCQKTSTVFLLLLLLASSSLLLLLHPPMLLLMHPPLLPLLLLMLSIQVFFVSGEQKFFNCIVFFNWEENPSRHVNRQVSPLPPSLSLSFFLSQSLRHPNTQASTLCLSLYLYVYGSVIASFGTGSCL